MADHSDLEREGVASTERAFARELRWTFRDQSVVDYGIDAHVEPKRDGVSVGKLIALQIKAGESYFRSKAPGGWYYTGNDRHLRYWLSFVLPVVVILYDPETGTCYWQHVAQEHITYTESGWKLLVPASQTLSADAVEPLMRIAESVPGASEDPLASYLSVLPPTTVVELEAAHGVEPGGSLRMASLLARGRSEPELTIQSLLAAQPSWWPAGKGRFEMTLATYASEHGYPLLAAEALARAAAVHDRPTAVLYANTAYFAALSGNPEQAEAFATLADETGGSPLLCAVARAIAGHDGRGPVEVPQSLKNASTGELAREPAALLFLGESAMARDDYEAAVGYLDSAVELLPSSSTAAIGLAYALLGRSALGRSVVIATDLRRVEALAGSALEQRRRWSGPSGDALAVLITLQVQTGAFKTALRMATPESQGGEALDREAASGQVAIQGAKAAMVIGDRERSADSPI